MVIRLLRYLKVFSYKISVMVVLYVFYLALNFGNIYMKL
jgi:hypothetical protein